MDSYICLNCNAIVVSDIPVDNKECPKCKEIDWKKVMEVSYDPAFFCQDNVFHPTVSC